MASKRWKPKGPDCIESPCGEYHVTREINRSPQVETDEHDYQYLLWRKSSPQRLRQGRWELISVHGKENNAYKAYKEAKTKPAAGRNQSSAPKTTGDGQSNG